MIFGLYTRKEVEKIKKEQQTACDAKLVLSQKETASLRTQLQTCLDGKTPVDPVPTAPAYNGQASNAVVKSMGYESLDTYGGKRGDRDFDNGAVFKHLLDTLQPGEQKNIYMEPGEYDFKQPIIMDNKTINILGYGSPMAPNASRLYFAADIPGIWVKRTEYTGMGEPIIENLSIRARNKGLQRYVGEGFNEPVSGLLIYQRSLVRNCEIYQWANHGITVFGHTGVAKFDANITKVQNCRTASNGGSGIWIVGPDANACQFEKINAVDNDEWGIDDNSFLGNLHLGHDTNNNKKGGYRTVNVTNASTFYGCYEEINQPLSVFARSFEETVFGGSIRKF